MNDFYEPQKLKIGQHVGVELDPYVLNYPMDSQKTTWVADQGGRPFVLRFFQSNKGKVEDFLQNARKYAAVKHPAITPNYPLFIPTCGYFLARPYAVAKTSIAFWVNIQTVPHLML
ncbi:hypothetical protein N5P32_03400 [Marinomonas pontica]|uniref:hypothetical protein n=1 Tax=Marinomonas pontica TaxID=264739 RepID=UPI002244BC51|nr:hypothetical protein [Marinomonas pontica]MCW8355010.1 hypothetical protein [Marinomonas pontica]